MFDLGGSFCLTRMLLLMSMEPWAVIKKAIH